VLIHFTLIGFHIFYEVAGDLGNLQSLLWRGKITILWTLFVHDYCLFLSLFQFNTILAIHSLISLCYEAWSLKDCRSLSFHFLLLLNSMDTSLRSSTYLFFFLTRYLNLRIICVGSLMSEIIQILWTLFQPSQTKTKVYNYYIWCGYYPYLEMGLQKDQHCIFGLY